jgi:hypothetical protein
VTPTRILAAFAAVAALSGCGDDTSFGGASTKSVKKSPPPPRPTAPAVSRPQTANASPAPAGGDEGEFDNRLGREHAKSGDIQISLLWNGLDDLDLHVITPAGHHIFFGTPTAEAGGRLDVDMNAGEKVSTRPVENVFWPTHSAPKGRYKIYVHHFSAADGDVTQSFTVRLKVDGKETFYRGTATFDAGASGFIVEGVDGPVPGDPPPINSALPPNAVPVHEFTY